MSTGCPLCGSVDGPRQATIGVAQAVGRRSPVEAIRSLLRRAHPQGLTAVELTAALRLPSTTVTGRLHELRARGEVRRAGERRNTSGRLAAVIAWVPDSERMENATTVEEVRAVVAAIGTDVGRAKALIRDRSLAVAP